MIGRAAVAFGVFGAEVANVGLAFLDEFEGVVVKLLKIIGGKKRFGLSAGRGGCEVEIGAAVGDERGGFGAFGFEAELRVGPAGDEPKNIRGDRVHVLDVFLDGIGVIEPQVALAVVFAGDAKIKADRFRVAEVEVPVGLGGETRDDLGVALFGDVAGDDIADEIARGQRRGRRSVLSGHSGTNCGARRGESTSQLEARA